MARDEHVQMLALLIITKCLQPGGFEFQAILPLQLGTVQIYAHENAKMLSAIKIQILRLKYFLISRETASNLH